MIPDDKQLHHELVDLSVELTNCISLRSCSTNIIIETLNPKIASFIENL